MKREFDKAWKDWLVTNTQAGCDKNELFKILFDEGFAYDVIKQEMAYEPNVPIFAITNPHAKSQKTKQKDSPKGKDIKKGELYLANASKQKVREHVYYEIDNFLNEMECERLLFTISASKQTHLIESTFERDFIKDLDTRFSQYIGISNAFSSPIRGYKLDEDTPEFSLPLMTKSEVQKDTGREVGVTHALIVFLNQAKGKIKATIFDNSKQVSAKIGQAYLIQCENESAKSIKHLININAGKGSSCAFVIKTFSQTVQRATQRTEQRTKQRTQQNTEADNKRYIKEASEYIPSYTRTGFIKTTFPKPVFTELSSFYQQNLAKMQQENVPGDFVFNTDKKKSGSSLIDLSDELRKRIHDTMKPLVEKWCGVPLEPTFVYGIRVYHDQAVLKSHRDRLATHVVGAIINVDQDVNSEWPLIIEDHFYRQHHVLLKPGEMIFYESGKLTHGRPIPLNGNLFANVFCHFKPVGYLQRNFAEQ